MYEYYVRKVENVVDGDTIDVLIDLGFDILFASRVRLAGIDTPESRTKDLAEKALGLEAKEYLKKALKDAKSVIIKTEKMDSSEKYGRILGWVYINGDTVSLNDMMINDGYAWGYLLPVPNRPRGYLPRSRTNHCQCHGPEWTPRLEGRRFGILGLPPSCSRTRRRPSVANWTAQRSLVERQAPPRPERQFRSG